MFEQILLQIRHPICFIFKWVTSWFVVVMLNLSLPCSLSLSFLIHCAIRVVCITVLPQAVQQSNLYVSLRYKLGPKKQRSKPWRPESICHCPATERQAWPLSSSGRLPWRVMLDADIVGMKEMSEWSRNNREKGTK